MRASDRQSPRQAARSRVRRPDDRRTSPRGPLAVLKPLDGLPGLFFVGPELRAFGLPSLDPFPELIGAVPLRRQRLLRPVRPRLGGGKPLTQGGDMVLQGLDMAGIAFLRWTISYDFEMPPLVVCEMPGLVRLISGIS